MKIIHFFSLEMSCTIEKALADAKALVERLREHDNAAEALIEQTTALNKRVEAMKQVCFSTLFTPSGVELGNTSFEVISVVCFECRISSYLVNPLMPYEVFLLWV